MEETLVVEDQSFACFEREGQHQVRIVEDREETFQRRIDRADPIFIDVEG